VDELFWMDHTLVAATHGRGIYEIDLSQTVEVFDAATKDGSGNPKTLFQPGDPIRWVLSVENHLALTTTVEMTWDVVDPLGDQVLFWQGDLSVPPGPSGWYIEGTVGLTRGTYVFTGTVDYQGSLSQDSTTYLVPSSILLVDDDDDSPDVLSIYTNTLTALNADYDVWDTGNSDNMEPLTETLSTYEAVIWFTGDAFGGGNYAGPGAAGEIALGNWLDQTDGCLLISGQDYAYDKGLTAFMADYLGVASIVQDLQYGTVSGQNAVFGGLGAYTLDNSLFTNWSDEINPGPGAETAFSYESGNGAVYKSNGSYKTTFLGFPFELLPDQGDREEVMRRFLSWCGLSGYQVYLPITIK
jgi:hypothetical protein